MIALEVFGGSEDDAVAIADRLDARLARAAAEAGPLVELGVSPTRPTRLRPPSSRRSWGARDPPAAASSRTSPSRSTSSTPSCKGLLAEPLAGVHQVAPYGRHPIAELAARGLLRPETVIAHAVLVDDAEIELLAASGASVAHCPRSNALLGCGIAPLAELRRAGVRVGLGTDGPSSALDLDAFAELRAAVMLQRASADPGALGAGDALRLATLGGAEALALEQSIGSLTPGKRGRTSSPCVWMTRPSGRAKIPLRILSSRVAENA